MNQSTQTCFCVIYCLKYKLHVWCWKLAKKFLFIVSSCSENAAGGFDRFSLDPLSPQLLRVDSRSYPERIKRGRQCNSILFSGVCTCQDHSPCCSWQLPLPSAASPCASGSSLPTQREVLLLLWGMLYLRHGKGHILLVLNSFLFLFLMPECSLFFNEVFSAKCVPDINLHSHQGDTI